MTLQNVKDYLFLFADQCWLLGRNPVWVNVQDNGGDRAQQFPTEVMVTMHFKTEHDGDYGMAIVFCVHALTRVQDVRGWIRSVFADELAQAEACLKTRRCNFAGAAC